MSQAVSRWVCHYAHHSVGQTRRDETTLHAAIHRCSEKKPFCAGPSLPDLMRTISEQNVTLATSLKPTAPPPTHPSPRRVLALFSTTKLHSFHSIHHTLICYYFFCFQYRCYVPVKHLRMNFWQLIIGYSIHSAFREYPSRFANYPIFES